jgi:predicted lipid-binding transport protein (Tim44 family)
LLNLKLLKPVIVMIAVLFISSVVFEHAAYARAGGGTSSGSRGSRSFSTPTRSYDSPAPQSQSAQQPPYQQPAGGGGFLRGLAGGILGGLIGGMLFRTLGFAGNGDGFGGGIGLFEILLVLGIGYFLYKKVFGKKREEARNSFQQPSYQTTEQADYEPHEKAGQSTRYDGLAYVRQMDPGFDESRFKDSVMDIFFKVQAAWMLRNLTSVGSILTEEMRQVFQTDIDKLIKDRQINRLENIAVRNVDVTEVWQESGQDFITVLFYANLLDYTVVDSNGEVISGSKTEPVKFEEFWTFTRPVGNNSWRLSAINQV